jgi:acylpyruvate hydrolase
LKLINYVHRSAPSELRTGCSFSGHYLDVTVAVAKSILNLPGPVARIEDILRTDGGLELLEEQMSRLDSTSPEIQSVLFDEPDVVLQAPVLQPQKLIGIGLNYRDHIEETKMEIPKEPLMFAMYSNAIISPEQPIDSGHEPED